MADKLPAPKINQAPEAGNVKFSRRDLLSTGSTLLNLGLSNNPYGGFLKGKYYYLVGDSESGKTFLSMTCFAEATINRHFAGYRFIYDNIEDGMLMDLDKLFSEEVADRIEPPELKDGKPVMSSTVQELYYHIDDAIKLGKPFIYILDSMDALDEQAEIDKFQAQKNAYRKNRDREKGEKKIEVAGSYGDVGKAKQNSQNIRKVLKGIRETGSILIFVSQTRSNVAGYGKTRSGGHSLKFYATTEIWTSVNEKIKRTVHGIERNIGSRILAQIRKNRITGGHSDVLLDIYPTVGFDDVGTMIDYLLEEKYWEVEKDTIIAKGLGFRASRDKLIKLIELNNRENDLRDLCGKCWDEVQAACAVKRKNKYQTGSDE